MKFWLNRYRLRRRQGASRVAAVVDAVLWPDHKTSFLSEKVGL